MNECRGDENANFDVGALFGGNGDKVFQSMSQKARHSLLVLNARKTRQRNFHHTAGLDAARRI